MKNLPLVFSFLVLPLCAADEVVVPAERAVTILQRAPDKSASYLAIRDQLNVVLLDFDLSAVPAGATVEKAVLQLRVDTTERHARDLGEVEERPPVLFRVHPVLAPWGDGVSWAQADIDTDWLDSGESGPLGLRFVDIRDLGQIEALPGGEDPFNAELDVTDWLKASIEDPSGNHGLALILDYASGYTVQANFNNGRQAPQISVEYAP